MHPSLRQQKNQVAVVALQAGLAAVAQVAVSSPIYQDLDQHFVQVSFDSVGFEFQLCCLDPESPADALQFQDQGNLRRRFCLVARFCEHWVLVAELSYLRWVFCYCQESAVVAAVAEIVADCGSDNSVQLVAAELASLPLPFQQNTAVLFVVSK